MSIQAVIFDLDGTLLDTLADIAHSMNHVLERNGYPQHSVESYRYRVGRGIRVLVKKSLPEQGLTPELIEPCVDEMERYYGEHMSDHTVVFAGVGEMLTGLTRQGILLSVVSNKPHVLVVQVVGRMLGDWPFVAVYGDRPDVASKPDPGSSLAAAREMGVSPDQTLFIGDSDVDMHTAIAAGMYPVGVSWGFRTEAELRTAGARDIVTHPREVIALIDRIDTHTSTFIEADSNRRAK